MAQIGIHCALQCEHGRGVLDVNNGGNGIPESGPRVINMANGAGSGNQNQQWLVTLASGSDSVVNIRNPRAEWYLYSRGNAENLGCGSVDPNNAVAQWDMVEERNGTDQPVKLGDYRGQMVRLRNRQHNLYIDLWELKNENGAPIKTGGRSGNNQRFKLINYW